MARVLSVPAFLLILGCCGCRPAEVPRTDVLAPPPPRPALTNPAENEVPKIRQAVRDFMKEAAPGATVEGVWVLQLHPTYCFAGADARMGGRRRTVDLLVRRYGKENGSEYWLAESLDGSLAETLGGRSSLHKELDSLRRDLGR